MAEQECSRTVVIQLDTQRGTGSGQPEEGPVLVTGASSDGQWRLQATDNREAYGVTWTDEELCSMLAKPHGANNVAEYKCIFADIFSKSGWASEVEVGARIKDSCLDLSVRKWLKGGILRPLFAFSLEQINGDEIDLFPWLVQTCYNRDSLNTKSSSTTKELAALTASFEQQSNQLQEFIQVKNEHDNALVEKFVLLLNEKKKKIWELQGLDTTSASKERQKRRRSSSSPCDEEMESDAHRAPASSSEDQLSEAVEDAAEEVPSSAVPQSTNGGDSDTDEGL